jgi:DUF1680 family protein
VTPTGPRTPVVSLSDGFWAPRQAQLRDHTLDVLAERLEAAGSLDAFRRLVDGRPIGERRGLWFSDSDVYKWLEAAAWAGRTDLVAPVAELVAAVQQPDGYLHTFYDAGAGSQARYRDLTTSHEHYCAGHLVEAALALDEVAGDEVLLDVARHWADHHLATFGPGRDTRVDGHPEAELALARLAARTGRAAYLDQARWMIDQQLGDVGRSVDTVELAGHTVKSLYLASGIAEVARADGDRRRTDAVARLLDSLVTAHAYPTGGVGGRWIDESVGKAFEQPDATSYAESCAAVASVQFCARAWDLTGDPRALEHIEVALFNAVPCGVGADGESWFYSQPHSVVDLEPESNPWATPFEYGPNMLLEWFPPHRHRWFDVACCPPNLARLFATVDHHVAAVDAAGDLLVHLPVAARITGGGWDVTVGGAYPDDGAVTVEVHAAPAGRDVRVRVPQWAGGTGHVTVPPAGTVDLPVTEEWWTTDRRVESAADTVFLRRGPVVHCVEGIDVADTDLRHLVVDPARPPREAFAALTPDADPGLHHPAPGARPAPGLPLEVPTVPYHRWANRGPTTMRIRFPRA